VYHLTHDGNRPGSLSPVIGTLPQPDHTAKTRDLLGNLVNHAQSLANLLHAVAEERAVTMDEQDWAPDIVDPTDWAICHDLLATLLEVSRVARNEYASPARLNPRPDRRRVGGWALAISPSESPADVREPGISQ